MITTKFRRSVLMGGLGTILLSTSALARPMTADDVARLEAVGGMDVAPDGTRIAYGLTVLPDILSGEDSGPPETQLQMAYAPGTGRDFLPDDMDVSHIRFSPDGRLVTFLWTDDSEDDEDDAYAALYAIPVDGGGHYKLAEVEEADVKSYAWGPDGQAVYLLAAAEENERRDDEEEAGFDSRVYEEEAKLNRLFRASVGGEVDAAPTAIEIPGYVSDLKVGPQGRFAAVASAPTPNVDDSYTRKRVHILDLAKGGVKAVVDTPGKIDDFEIAPDGRTLSLIAGVDENDPAPTTLHFVDVATGEFRALNAGATEAAMDAEWLADGRLAAVIHVGAQSLFRIYNADGSVADEIDPGSLILTNVETGGTRVAVRANSPEHPNELYVLEGGRFERWTMHNPWLEEIDFGEQRTVTYTARDGQEVEGILIEPVEGAPDGGAPTIFTVHGGPEAHDSNGWLTSYSDPGQVGAGAGYAVFYPNYRGSTGYGTAFSKQHQNDYAGAEFNDLVDGADALAEMSVADRSRVGITGGSYGGYATGWASTALSEHFAAGVMFVGISNQISKFGTTDIPREMYLVHSRQWPWEDWQNMLEVSPIYYAGQADTPLLIMHGEEDTRVSPSQSYELYRNIKVRTDTPVRLVLYPGEGHGNQNAAARYDYNLRMMRWFDTYLKTGDRDAELPPPRPVLPDSVIDDD